MVLSSAAGRLRQADSPRRHLGVGISSRFFYGFSDPKVTMMLGLFPATRAKGTHMRVRGADFCAACLVDLAHLIDRRAVRASSANADRSD